MDQIIGNSRSNLLRVPDRDTTWGTPGEFAQLTGVNDSDAHYWATTVWRPAHRVGHPRLNIADCPGCIYEQAVQAIARKRTAA